MTRSRGAVVTALILLLTVVQLAVGAFGSLQQFDGKGFGYRLIAYPALMLLVPVLWWWRNRPTTGRTDVPWTAFALLTAPFLVDVTGNTLDLYDTVEWWDNANHFWNWALLLAGLGLLLARSDIGSGWVLVLVITGLGAILAIGWELGEWYTFIRRGTELDGAYEDTLSDLLLGTLGALLAGVVVARLRRSRAAG